MARSGKLRAYKLNRDWLTTPAAISKYLKSQTKRHEKALSLLQTAEKAFLAFTILLIVASITPRAHAQELNTPPLASNAISSTLHEVAAVWKQFVAFYKPEFADIGSQANHSLLSLGEALLGKTTEEFLADAPAPKSLTHAGRFAVNTSISPSAEAVPQVLGVSIAQSTVQPEAPATPSQIQSLIEQTLQRYLVSGKFIGPQGPQGPAGQNSSGLVQGSNGQSTAVIGGTPIVTYIPASNNNNFTGGSVAGFTNLSSQTLSAVNQSVTGQLTVSGSALFANGLTAATSTLSALTVTGAVNLTGSTTITGLTVTGFNPGLTQGSVAFQGATSLTQDNANLFFDSTNHRLGIGTTTPSQTLTVLGNASISGNATTTGHFSAGTITAASFAGNGSGLTNLNAANLTSSSVERDSFGRYYLRQWQAKLGTMQTAGNPNTQAVVNVIGDSWTAGQSITTPLKVYLQSKLGNIGPGYNSFANGETVVSGITMSTLGTWVDTTGSSALGVDLYDTTSSDVATPASKTVTATAAGFTALYYQQPGGGSFSYAVDSAATTTVSTAGLASVQSITVSGLSLASHSVVFTLTAAGSAGVRLIGITFQSPGHGALINRFGHSGATTGNYTAVSASTWEAALTTTNADVNVIILGVNDMNAAISTSTMSANLTSLISRIQAALPNSDVVLLTQTDSGLTPSTPQVNYVNSQQDLARSLNVGFVDAFKALGPYNGNARNLYLGNNHPNGNGGQAIANLLNVYLNQSLDLSVGQYGNTLFGYSPTNDDNVNGYQFNGIIKATGFTTGTFTAVLGGTSLPTVNGIPYVTSAGVLGQDPVNLYYDPTNKRLGIGINTPSTDLHIRKSVSVTATFETTGNAASAIVYKNANTNWSVGLGAYNGSGFDWQINHNGTLVFDVTNGNTVSIGPSVGTSGTGTLYVKDATPSTGATQVLVQGGAAAADATTNQLFRVNQGGGTNGIFVVQGNGNVGIGTTTPTLGPLTMASGAYVTAGGTWTNASDRNLKEGFATITPNDILQKIDQLPITEWSYKSEGPLVKHIGPVAQDFYALFQVGNSSTSISTIDPSGIALLGIQALDQKIAALQGSLTGNATASNLSVYVPGHFSGDSVGEAKILAGQTSVHISFHQPYSEQPIVVADVLAAFVQHAIDTVDATGFQITMPAATSTDVTFTWHSFASPQAQLSVSDGTTLPIHLAVVPSVSTAPEAPQTATSTTPDVLGTTTPATAVDATSTSPSVQTPASAAPTASTAPIVSAPATSQDAPPQAPAPLIVVTAPSPDAGLTPTAPSNAQN